MCHLDVNQIRASEVNFWTEFNDYQTMLGMHQRNMYPPRVTMTVARRESFTIPIKFEGCESKYQLNVKVNFPLGLGKYHNCN